MNVFIREVMDSTVISSCIGCQPLPMSSLPLPAFLEKGTNMWRWTWHQSVTQRLNNTHFLELEHGENHQAREHSRHGLHPVWSVMLCLWMKMDKKLRANWSITINPKYFGQDHMHRNISVTMDRWNYQQHEEFWGWCHLLLPFLVIW